jgi:deazaflavin-dependent oxidoreductase (nitroreductase family)
MRERLRRTWFRAVGVGGTSRLSLLLHPLLYRWSGGIGPLGHFLGNRVAIMTTIGARTGKPRSVPIWVYPDGDEWIVVASRGGDTRLPGWYHNLQANPRATLQLGREHLEVEAREATGVEHERLWEMVINAYPGYAYYRERIGRHIPIMVLQPAVAPSTASAPGAASDEADQ